MKKILGICLSVVLLASVAYCLQPFNMGNVKTDGLAIPSYTLAQMNSLTSDTTGQLIFVSDALQSKVCVSSGTLAAGAWILPTSTGVFAAGSNDHCR